MKPASAFHFASLLFTSLLPVPAGAQWLNYKTPGIPRAADGKLDLAAPAPKAADGKPDFSVCGGLTPSAGPRPAGQWRPLHAKPWAAALYERRKEELGRDNYSVTCLPPGPIVDLGAGRVVQTPNLLLMLFSGTRIVKSSRMAGACPKILIPTGWAIRWGIGRETRW
jgi:hypothetical protein